ncbi:MAG: TerB family tellurite resistance protein [Bacteroidota bacterium]
MKEDNYRLYDAFGELLYVLAKSDGKVQQEEIETLKSLLHSHSWAKEIEWSFNYEMNKENNLEDTYLKVYHACVDIGPNKEYALMLDVLEKVAASSYGVVEEERAIIERFQSDLLREFGK